MGEKKGENKLEDIIVNGSFWTALSDLVAIVRPIHEAQKVSESNGATLAKVVPRWQKLEQELQSLSTVYPDLAPFIAKGGLFHTRSNTQMQPIHYAAMLLDPISWLRAENTMETDIVEQWLLS